MFKSDVKIKKDSKEVMEKEGKSKNRAEKIEKYQFYNSTEKMSGA